MPKTLSQKLEDANTELETTKSELETAKSENAEQKTEIEDLKSQVTDLTSTITTIKDELAALRSEKEDEDKDKDSEGDDGDDDDKESKNKSADGEDDDDKEKGGDSEGDDDEDEETKSQLAIILKLAGVAIKGLQEDNAAKSALIKELQDKDMSVESRASKMLITKCAELGISEPLNTGDPSGGASDGAHTITKAEFKKLSPQQQNKHFRAGGKVKG